MYMQYVYVRAIRIHLHEIRIQTTASYCHCIFLYVIIAGCVAPLFYQQGPTFAGDGESVNC